MKLFKSIFHITFLFVQQSRSLYYYDDQPPYLRNYIEITPYYQNKYETYNFNNPARKIKRRSFHKYFANSCGSSDCDYEDDKECLCSCDECVQSKPCCTSVCDQCRRKTGPQPQIVHYPVPLLIFPSQKSTKSNQLTEKDKENKSDKDTDSTKNFDKDTVDTKPQDEKTETNTEEIPKSSEKPETPANPDESANKSTKVTEQFPNTDQPQVESTEPTSSYHENENLIETTPKFIEYFDEPVKERLADKKLVSFSPSWFRSTRDNMEGKKTKPSPVVEDLQDVSIDYGEYKDKTPKVNVSRCDPVANCYYWDWKNANQENNFSPVKRFRPTTIGMNRRKLKVTTQHKDTVTNRFARKLVDSIYKRMLLPK